MAFPLEINLAFNVRTKGVANFGRLWLLKSAEGDPWVLRGNGDSPLALPLDSSLIRDS